jgi:hypothetical protein
MASPYNGCNRRPCQPTKCQIEFQNVRPPTAQTLPLICGTTAGRWQLLDKITTIAGVHVRGRSTYSRPKTSHGPSSESGEAFRAPWGCSVPTAPAARWSGYAANQAPGQRRVAALRGSGSCREVTSGRAPPVCPAPALRQSFSSVSSSASDSSERSAFTRGGGVDIALDGDRRQLAMLIRHDPIKHLAQRLQRPAFGLRVSFRVLPPINQRRGHCLLSLQVGELGMLSRNRDPFFRPALGGLGTPRWNGICYFHVIFGPARHLA